MLGISIYVTDVEHNLIPINMSFVRASKWSAFIENKDREKWRATNAVERVT